jgi:leader peptidase (prepilin peptidase)/N-methyltransferase
MSVAYSAVMAGAFGALLGSFLNVVAHRLPLKQSVVHPRSRCPHCETQIRSFDNVPVVSWLLLRGRCRDCLKPISARYPLVELATGVLLAAVALAAADVTALLLGVTLVLLLVPITLIDLDHRIIPNRLTLIGALSAPAILAVTEPAALPEHLLAGLGAGGFLLAAALARPGGMGMGDVKLAGMLGLFLGSAVAPALLVALLTGTLVGAAIIAAKGGDGRKTAIPFGPFLALGGVVGLFAGAPIVSWYLETFLL